MSPARRSLSPLTVVLYATLIGLLLTSYVAPLRQIFEGRAQIPALQQRLEETQDYNDRQRRLIEDLNTPEGIELAARERYGMILPGEKVYIIPK